MASHRRSSAGSGKGGARAPASPPQEDAPHRDLRLAAPTRGPQRGRLRDIRLEERAASRGRILDVAMAVIGRDGADAFTMRELAKALDCSPMALYSYFAGKHDILHALAHRDFASLAARLARRRSGDPLADLRDLFAELARFAFENPAQYRTMFMVPEAVPAGAAKDESAIYRENPAFSTSVDRVRACIEAGAFAGDSHAATTLLWTAVHGAVAAIIAFPAFPFGEPGRYVGRVVEAMLLCFAAQRVEPL